MLYRDASKQQPLTTHTNSTMLQRSIHERLAASQSFLLGHFADVIKKTCPKCPSLWEAAHILQSFQFLLIKLHFQQHSQAFQENSPRVRNGGKLNPLWVRVMCDQVESLTYVKTYVNRDDDDDDDDRKTATTHSSTKPLLTSWKDD